MSQGSAKRRLSSDDEFPDPTLVPSNQTFEEMIAAGSVRIDWPNDLAWPSRMNAFEAARRGQIPGHGVTDHVSFYWQDGTAEGWAWLKVGHDRYLFRRTVLRSYHIDCGILPGALACDLSAADIGSALSRYLAQRRPT